MTQGTPALMGTKSTLFVQDASLQTAIDAGVTPFEVKRSEDTRKAEEIQPSLDQ
ncbi:hypothetical protein ACP70R_025093 [Stipagrostis hirtigluma subsp. patula]